MNALAEHGRKRGLANRVRVHTWLLLHPGGTNRECAAALGLHEMAVGRHVKAIRQTWLNNPAPGGSGQSSMEPPMATASDDTDDIDTGPSFGQRAVGLTFNPGGDPLVHSTKERFADLIDEMDHVRQHSTDPERIRLACIAINELQTAQMWAVKALTWRG
jgi:hypothetical protein